MKIQARMSGRPHYWQLDVAAPPPPTVVFDLDDGAASGIYNLLKSAEHAHRG